MFAFEVAPPLEGYISDLESASVDDLESAPLDWADDMESSAPLDLAHTVAKSAVHQHPPWIQAHQIWVT